MPPNAKPDRKFIGTQATTSFWRSPRREVPNSSSLFVVFWFSVVETGVVALSLGQNRMAAGKIFVTKPLHARQIRYADIA